MGIQAQWHDIAWEVSDHCIRSITNIETNMDLNYERHEDTDGAPPTQTVQRGLQTIKIDYRAYGRLGAVWPKGDIDAWYYHIGRGTHAVFYIWGESFEGREFIVTHAEMTSETVDVNGVMLYGDISVTLEEYAEEPSGLKVDKGFDISFTPGIRERVQDENAIAIMLRAKENDKQLMLQSLNAEHNTARF